MNRTDRLYAIVEELRAVSPRPRSAAWLARQFGVTPRTVERDLEALRRSGLPIRAQVGQAGGYSLDRSRTLAPISLTAGEALAISVALRSAGATPFAATARRAGQKVMAVLPADVRRSEEDLARRIHQVGDHPHAIDRQIADPVQEAVITGRVLRLAYTDAGGVRTSRDVEPMALLWGPQGWYLMGWCRLRLAVRGFQLDRITTAVVTDERPAPRPEQLAAELDRLAALPLPT